MNVSISFFCALLLCFNGGLYAQFSLTDSTASIAVNWKQGDHAKYSLVEITQKIEQGKVIRTDTATSVFDMRILKASSNGYVIRWKSKANPSNTGYWVDSIMRPIIQYTNEISFNYKTDELGQFQELINWKDIRSTVYKFLDSLSSKSSPDARYDSLLAGIRKLYASKKSMEELMLGPVHIFHGLYGGEYTLQQEIAADDEVSNFLIESPPLPAKLKVKLVKIDQKARRGTMHVDQTFDREKVSAALNDWMVKMGMPQEQLLHYFNFNYNFDIEFDLVKGWVMRVDYVQTATSGSSSSIVTSTYKKMD